LISSHWTRPGLRCVKTFKRCPKRNGSSAVRSGACTKRERSQAVEIERSFSRGSILLKDRQLGDFLLSLGFALLSLRQTLVQIVTRGVRSFLHADAQISLHAMIGIGNQSPGLTNGMKWANLMGDRRPELSNGLSLGWLSIADHPDHWDLECHDRGQKLFQAFFRALHHLFCMQYPSRQDLTEQRDRFMPLIGLNPLKREHNAFIFPYLLFPSFIMGTCVPARHKAV
jgi:hypothetical protein